MPIYNLMDEPWIPCAPPTGGAPKLLSLRDALVTAHEQREIVDDSPLVTVALHRLLLALLHRVYQGPTNVDQWRSLLDAGRFDTAKLDAYIERWRHRFHLFDDQRPFYQVAQMADVNAVSVAKLAHERASGNNITLFDHSTEASTAFTPAQAARYLIAFQAFAIGGGVSSPFNLSDAPLARDYTVLMRGDTLFETLLLNLVRYDESTPIPWLGSDDPPCWEREDFLPPDKDGTPPAGYLDYLTWQSRSIHLLYDDATGYVRQCQIRQNYKLASSNFDPFKPYRRSKERGMLPLRFSEAKSAWRDSHALLEAASDTSEGKRPDVFEWLAATTRSGLGERRGEKRRYAFDVLGFLNDGAQATIILWRQDRLPLPLEYLTERSLRDRLNDGLQLAERVGTLFLRGFATDDNKNKFPRPLQVLAQELLAPTSGYEPNGRRTQERDADPKSVSNQIDHLAVERVYWAALEPHFERFMVDLAELSQSKGDAGGIEALLAWAREIDRSATRAFTVATASLDTNRRTIQATARAESAFNLQLSWQLNTALAPYRVTAATLRKGHP